MRSLSMGVVRAVAPSGNQRGESRFAKGRKPFDWGFGGCAPDALSLFSAAFGGQKTTVQQP